MNRARRFGTAISAIAVAAALSGCAANSGVRESMFGSKVDHSNIGLATRAQAALAAEQFGTAVELAERAVENSPSDAGFRALLGNCYFAAGRFASAEAAFGDALTLIPGQPQVVLKLALVEIAQGKNGEALTTLEAARGTLDPADYGLAVALAGRPADAVAVLNHAARTTSADARVRQNLALAYGLTGDWTMARTVAAQDVAPDQLDSRIQQWMAMATPARPSDQVAALTGVHPAADPGQPQRLALRNIPQNTQAYAQLVVPQAQPAADQTASAPAAALQQLPAPQPQAEPMVVPQAQAEPMPQPQAEAMPVEAVAEAARSLLKPAPQPQPETQIGIAPPPPLVVAAAGAAGNPVVDLPTRFDEPVEPAKYVAITDTVRRAAERAHRANGRSHAVVQLGAYRSPQGVAAAWTTLTRRYPALKSYTPMRARFAGAKGIVWRLSIKGFASQQEAISRCELLQSRGGSCFVRTIAGDAPVQMASR